MPTYLERYLAGEREQVWAELSARGPAIRAEPLFAEAQAVARETMTRARANVALLVQRLTSLGYRFVSDALGPRPTPYALRAVNRWPRCASSNTSTVPSRSRSRHGMRSSARWTSWASTRA